MPTKTGMGGHAPEAYDPKTGKFIEDGAPNVRYDNQKEANKIKNHISPEKIQEQSAAKQTAPTPNLGKYAKPHSGVPSVSEPKKEDVIEKSETLRNEFGIDNDYSDEAIEKGVYHSFDYDFSELFDYDQEEEDRFWFNGGMPKAIQSFVYDKGGPEISRDLAKRIYKSGKFPEELLNKIGYNDSYEGPDIDDEFDEYLKQYIKERTYE